MTHHPTTDRTVLFGGLLGDTWEWDGVNWIAVTPANSPSARRSFPLAFYPPRGTVVLVSQGGAISTVMAWRIS